jgi:hypothetical protein
MRSAITKRLKELPAAIAGDLVNIKDAPQIAKRLDNAVRELLWTVNKDLGEPDRRRGI